MVRYRPQLIAFALLGLVGVFASGGAYAQTGSWTVISARGSVQAAADTTGTLQSLAVGDAVTANAVIVSGTDGRAVLERAGDKIDIAPNTRIELQPEAASTTVLQSVGRAVYDIVTGGGPRFEVRTPFLIAGVKGTVFSVTVTGQGTAVSVSEGVVGVSPSGAGQGFAAADVTPGQSANASFGAGGLSVTVGGTPPGQDPESVRGASPPSDSRSDAAPANRGNGTTAQAARGNSGNGNGNGAGNNANGGNGNNGNGGGLGLSSVDNPGGNAGGNGGGNAGGNGSGNAGGNGGGNAGGNSGGNAGGNDGGNAGGNGGGNAGGNGGGNGNGNGNGN